MREKYNEIRELFVLFLFYLVQREDAHRSQSKAEIEDGLKT